jgi:hypothetical protein
MAESCSVENGFGKVAASCPEPSNGSPAVGRGSPGVPTVVTPPSTTISIDPFFGVCKDKTLDVIIRVSGAESAKADLKILPSGARPKAAFVDNGSTVLNNVTIKRDGTPVAIKGLDSSDHVDDLGLVAKLTSNGKEAKESFSVVHVEVVRFSVCRDLVEYTLSPSGVEGELTLQLTRSGGRQPVVVVGPKMVRGGTMDADLMGVYDLPDGAYEALESIWKVNGFECRELYTDSQTPFTVLGDYRITCYFRPLETDYGPPVTSVCTLVDSSPCIWSNQMFNPGFLAAVRQQGAGVTRSGEGIRIKEGDDCPPPSRNCPDFAGYRYRSPAPLVGSCPPSEPIADMTVARGFRNTTLRCFDNVCIRGFDQVFQVNDSGPAVGPEQLDLFRGAGREVCQEWPNPRVKVIRLGR